MSDVKDQYLLRTKEGKVLTANPEKKQLRAVDRQNSSKNGTNVFSDELLCRTASYFSSVSQTDRRHKEKQCCYQVHLYRYISQCNIFIL